MKKNYSKPIALMETFTPNHYCASCPGEWDWSIACAGESLISLDGGQSSKHINPQDHTEHNKLYFTQSAYNDIMSYRQACMYDPMHDNPDVGWINGWVVHIHPSSENGSSEDTPITAVQTWNGHSGGDGIIVFQSDEHWIKNQS